jgi:hypothetical protein
VAGEAGLVKGGTGATDGTTLPGNASRHKAMSAGSRRKEADRWREALAALGTQAHQHDAEAEAALGSRRGDALPAALARREARLAPIEAARRRLEARAKAEADAERQRRAAGEAQRQRLGPPRRGKAPKPVDEPPDDKAQTTCTAPAWQLMRPTNKGWEDGGHAQARVAAAHPMIVACDVTAASNATQPAEPRAQRTGASLEQAGRGPPTDATGTAPPMPATEESGYYSAAAAAAVEQWGVEPSRATARQRPQAPEAESPALRAPAQERMAAQGRTPAGRAVDARRTVIVEPVFGQSKEGRGFRRGLLRGVDPIRGAWQ